MHCRLEITSDLKRLGELRAAVVDCCRQAWGEGVARESVERLELALQEAASNIVLHAYDNQPDRPIIAEIETDTKSCRVTLWHEGRDFDPTEVRVPAFDGSRFGGFGQYLIGQCTDEFRYIHGPDQRGIRLIKHREPATGGRRMNLIVETFGDVAVVNVNEEQIDASTADLFRQSMAPVLASHRHVVLDLGKLNFIDSRGCGAILSCLKALTESGGDLHLCRVNRPVRTVFDFIRLHRICDIYDTKEQAVEAFRTKTEARKRDAGL
jgi:anti-anti-sigma factor